jgi:hypothetical protein
MMAMFMQMCLIAKILLSFTKLAIREIQLLHIQVYLKRT